jgi:hypothetical protein
MTRRQISDEEKSAIITKQGLRCFIDNHPVEDASELDFDHIFPFSEGGATTTANIGAVCRQHNQAKGTLTLTEFRDRLALRAFFEGAKKRRLDDLLAHRLGQGVTARPVVFEVSGDTINLYLDDGAQQFPMFRCPGTNERYFYAVLPVSLIKNDVELQPRTLEAERVWELYRHLLTRTQLAPAICRLAKGHLLLFDGQHKTAAQVWAGRKVVDCKVYLDPDVRRLKETNLSAHDKLRQMPFYTLVLLEKYAGLAAEDWQLFLEVDGRRDEAAFVDFMRSKRQLSKSDANKRIEALIQQSIVEHPENGMRDFHC